MAKRRATSADLVTRPATSDDGSHLSSFKCSEGEWYEDEVEEYLKNQAIKHLADTGGLTYHLLLTLEKDELIACAGHHVEPLIIDSGHLIEFVRLYVLAISLDHRGRRLDDGTALSDAMLRLAASDAHAAHGDKPLTAIVANQNRRSMAVVERNGRWSQVRYGGSYTRFVGQMKIEE
ncbi:MAG TPA: hypothetical protein VFN18_05565 [Solirubrobacterales bacterium]|nr:hypothetical protein [Solirubrobacterales bacterium]